MSKPLKNTIAVIGQGYVGLSLSCLLSQYNKIYAVDIDKQKVVKLNKKISPINNDHIDEYLNNKQLDLTATTDIKYAIKQSDYIIIATPTNYDPNSKFFDTSSIESTLNLVKKNNPNINIIIKSTVPVGYTKKIQNKYNFKNIFFVPEFLRETKAIYDNIHPSRIIIGHNSNKKHAIEVANLFKQICIDSTTPILYMSTSEAESVKLFSNTYLAMRIAFFNELDTFATNKNLNTKNIIEGVSLDPRCGNYYNNPSFGYGGYCLPKDTKQLRANYDDIPQDLIDAIIKSNKTRKDFIIKEIKEKLKGIHNPVIGIYLLTMKKDSDNFRESSILDILEALKKLGIPILIYEPSIKNSSYNEFKVENNLNNFIDKSSLIIANRISQDLLNTCNKIFTCDIFYNN